MIGQRQLVRHLTKSSVINGLLVSPPHPVSHLRRVVYTETPPDAKLKTAEHPYSLHEFNSHEEKPDFQLWERMHMEQLDRFNHDYWVESNTRFESGKAAIISALPPTTTELEKEATLSEFYRSWVEQESSRQREYDKQWHQSNRQSISLALSKEWKRLKSKIGFGDD